MTSTTDTAGHPDVTEISDLTEGLLTPSQSADMQRHLDGCVLCADVYASLEEIRGLLGTMPGAERMPDDVAERIDAALAAEADVSRETSAPVDRLTDRLTDRPTGHAHAATGPGRKDRARRGRRRTIVLGTVFTAAALGLGSLLVSSLGDDSKAPVVASTFSGQKVETQVAEILKGRDVKKSPRTGGPSVGIESHTSAPGDNEHDGLIFDVPTVPDCVMKGIGRTGASVLGLKEGTYDGTDAYLVVLPAAGDTTRVTAYVVDSACEKKPSVSAKVLLTQSYARR
ncbi:anti-sigma factor family protein [Streptomyces geranii]|uniref:anti-sigma factor family protein n=1 Tax=Streptomyces geranii TaxID=2058923 RepID=UPI000D02F7FB|nr:hypothetical protein [Streptomyces geranii]